MLTEASAPCKPISTKNAKPENHRANFKFVVCIIIGTIKSPLLKGPIQQHGIGLLEGQYCIWQSLQCFWWFSILISMIFQTNTWKKYLIFLNKENDFFGKYLLKKYISRLIYIILKISSKCKQLSRLFVIIHWFLN